jgi:hypothetical protein
LKSTQKAAIAEEPLERGEGQLLMRALKGFTEQQEARSVTVKG